VDVSAANAGKEGSIIDPAELEKYFREAIKVDNKKNNLGEAVIVAREGANKITVTVKVGTVLAKRYVKYLTKKYLRKQSLRDFLRIVASEKTAYKLAFYKLSADAEDDE